VLDNVATLPRSKMGLIRLLSASRRFALVVIAEPFLSPWALEQLRVSLVPAPVVRLGRLSHGRAREYFALASEIYELGFSADRIATEAAATRGYPLGMWEAVKRARSRSAAFPDDRALRPGKDFASSSKEH